MEAAAWTVVLAVGLSLAALLFLVTNLQVEQRREHRHHELAARPDVPPAGAAQRSAAGRPHPAGSPQPDEDRPAAHHHRRKEHP
jgi:hypothetical protein